MKYPLNPQTSQPLDQQSAIAFARQNGTTLRPQPPRNLQTQAGSRKALLTWDAPLVANGLVGFKIYTDNENSLLDTLYDPNVRQYNVPASSGATPPTKNVFISAFSKNSESVKVQIQVHATAEAGAPTDPAPPPGSAASGTTGAKFSFDGGDSSDAGFVR